MATGIESVVLRLQGHAALSETFLWLAVAAWGVLAAVVPMRALHGDAAVRTSMRSPSALTAVAGTCVLGTCAVQRGWETVGGMALVVASIVWLGLQPPVWRQWATPATGAAFLTTVSAEALAVLCAGVATTHRAPWLLGVGIALAAAGIALYAVVLASFDTGQLLSGGGDHWVAGGALAIAALASADLASAARGFSWPHWIGHDIAIASAILAGAAAAWLPLLIIGELSRPRFAYDVRRWATVFPVAMYSAAGHAVGRVGGAPALVTLARWWGWVALAVWAAVAAGMLHRGLRRAREASVVSGL